MLESGLNDSLPAYERLRLPWSRSKARPPGDEPSESLEDSRSDDTPEGSLSRGLGRLDFRSLWKNASWTSASLVVATALGFAESIVLARCLGVTLLGYFVLIRSFPEAVQQILDCRTRETIVKYLGEFVALGQRERAGAVVRLIWLVDAAAGLVAMAIVFATASLAARYIVHDATATWLVAIYATSQFVGTLDSASGSVVRVFDRFGVASAMGACQAVARFTGILAALLLGGGINALIYVLVGIEVLYTFSAACVALWLLRKHIGFRIWGALGAIRDRRKEILKFLLHTNIAGTLKMSSDKLVLVIVGALGGAPVAAQYKIASQTGTSLLFFSDPFYQVIYPSLAKMVARRQWDAIFSGLRRLRRITLTVAIPGAAVASGLMVPLIPLVFGSEFKPAVIPGIMILWAVVPNVVLFWRRPLLLSLGQAAQLVRYRATASALQLILTLVLVRPAGVIGAAVGMLAMQWVYAALEIRLMDSWRRRLEHSEPSE